MFEKCVLITGESQETATCHLYVHNNFKHYNLGLVLIQDLNTILWELTTCNKTFVKRSLTSEPDNSHLYLEEYVVTRIHDFGQGFKKIIA